MDGRTDKPVSPEGIGTIREAHTWASRFLSTKHVLYPERNVEWMLRKLLNWDSLAWLTRWNEPFHSLPESVKQTFFDWVERRANREPLQYILGDAEFYGRDFHVTPAVLIPRPETECLVDRILETIPTLADKRSLEQNVIRIVDIGVGSGAIAVTLALELQKLQQKQPNACSFEIHAVDISEDALAIASDNAARLGADITFHHGNGLQPIIDAAIPVHVIVSNPPYITDEEMQELQEEVKDYEPHLALHGGLDGMDPYRLILTQAQELPGGTTQLQLIGFEVGHQQASQISSMIEQMIGFRSNIFQDLAEIPRMVFGYNPSFCS